MPRMIAFLLIFVSTGLTSHSFAQADRSGVLPPNNRYCLVQRETAAINCMFATMQQCLESANVGREGECIPNPTLPPSIEPRERR